VEPIPQPGKIFEIFFLECLGGGNGSPCIQRVSAISTVNQSVLDIVFDGDAQAGVSVIPSSGGGAFDCDGVAPCHQMESPNETVQPRLVGPGDMHLGYLPDCLGVTNCVVDLRPDKTLTALFTRNTPKRVTIDAAGNVAGGVTYQLMDITGTTVIGGGACDGD